MASLRARKQQAPLQTNVLSYLEQRVCGRRLADERHLIRNRLAMAKSLYRKDLVGHFGCVNAIEFTNGTGEWIVSGGDDRRVLVWNIQRALSGRSKPVAMKGQHNSNIFCLGFDMDNKRIFSGGNDEQVIYHDFETGATLDVFRHDDVVYGLSVDPNNNNVFASAADDGVVRVFDVRDPDPFVLADCTSSMHAVMYNPAEPRLLVTANNAYGAALWDIRKPKKSLLKYVGDFGRKQQHNCMSVRVNALGTQVIALYRRRPLMLYNIDSPSPVYKFSSADTEYANSCTMKSCSFAGDKDQYVLSGSDSFHVFVWPVPSTDYLMHRGSRSVTSTHMLLKGHRSIVNQVRYSPANHLLVSSGVEKVVKIWSAFPIPGGQCGLMAEETPTETERVRFTQEQYMNIMLRQEMMHDYSNGDVEEDPHMMAFFDSLIAAGGDPWSSDDDSSDLYDIQPFIMYSETSSDSIDPQRDGVALSREQSVAESCEESEAAQNDALSSESATNTTQDDGTNNVSDSDPSDEETSGQRILTKLVESAPYRARANQAVKRLQRLRNRVENSETSDSDSSNSDTSASTSNGRLVKGPGKSVTQTESTDNESAPNNSSSNNCGDKVSITSNDCDTNPYGTSRSCYSKLYKCGSNNVDRANTSTCDSAHVAENPKSNSAPARQGSNGNVLKSNNNLHDRGPGSNRVCDHVDGLAPRGTEVNGNVYSKASTSATGLDNRTVLTESSDQQNSNDFKRLKKHKDRRQYRRKTSQNVSSEDDDP